jgi:hypothetical protein
LGMNDYDYYFLFGQSSLEALQARKLRFGSSQAVLAGSHMIDCSYNLPPADPSLRAVMILGVGPDKEKEAGYLATYALLRDWAAAHPEYTVLVKAHPRSQVPFWQEAARKLSNVQVLSSACTLAVALEQASVVANIMSNAVIEAALARRPIVYVNASGEEDIFDQERFIGACVTDLSALTGRLEEIAVTYSQCVIQAQCFADFHLAGGTEGLSNTVRLIDELLMHGRCDGQPLHQSNSICER